MPRKGGKRKKTRTHVDAAREEGGIGEDVPDDNIPRSIVARAGKVSPPVAEFVQDLRKLIGPHTASNLRERSYNKIKDYAAVASQLGVTHLLAVTQTKKNIILRVARFHNGPTLHFRISEYSLCKHIRATQKRPFDSAAAYRTPPLVVLNNFGTSEESHMKLLRTTLQHMFPSINVKTVRLNECRRVVLFHYKKDEQIVEMRHYAIRATPTGLNKNIKRIVQAKLPNMANMEDVSEYVEGNQYAGATSDSELDDETTHVELPDKFVGLGNVKTQQSAVRLVELGPRATFELYKVERGMCEGDILYHRFEQKTPEEAAATKSRIENARRLKAERKAIQAANVEKKRAALEEKRRLKEEKKRRRLESGVATEESDEEEDDSSEDEEDDGQEFDYDNMSEEEYSSGDEGDDEENQIE